MTAQRLVRVLSPLPFVLTAARRGSVAMLAAIIGTLASVPPLPADAALSEGQTVETTDFHGTAPDMTTIIGPVSSVVGSGVELTNFGFDGFVDINFSATNILITATIDQPFGFLEVLRFVAINSTKPAFPGLTVNSATNWTGFDASAISFLDPDRIDLNLTALGGLQGQVISLNLSSTNGVISEPPAYLLLGIAALGMLGIASRRRKVME
jgi:hypothetical protein